jgi:hypothetical protein
MRAAAGGEKASAIAAFLNGENLERFLWHFFSHYLTQPRVSMT